MKDDPSGTPSSQPAVALTEAMVRNVVLNWYHGTNEHVPVEDLELMLADDVAMSYPNTPTPIIGKPAFRRWYEDVLGKYFDETHVVEWWHIELQGDSALARVIVRWETRSWNAGHRVSEYRAYLSQQRFLVAREPSSGRVVIREKHVETFGPAAAIYGPTVVHDVASGAGSAIAPAIEAAREGDFARIDGWLSAGGNPNQYDADGWTPLLAAAARGQTAVVARLLDNAACPADLQIAHLRSGALPIHLAGQSGDVATARELLERRPDHLDAVWTLNGHTLLLQAVFFGHLALARFALARGADTAITTVRGLGAMELARQFQNTAMTEQLAPYDRPARSKQAYYDTLLRRMTPYVRAEEEERQKVADDLIQSIQEGLRRAANEPSSVDKCLAEVRALLESNLVDVNRLAGVLRQPPLTAAVTGSDGDPPNPAITRFRQEVVSELLSGGADPTVEERHPMAVNAIIRAAVFNHLSALKAMGAALRPETLERVLNVQPPVNGLTALHDTVLRAGTTSEARAQGYLDQIVWLLAHGARADIPDYSGATQRDLAEAVVDENRRRQILMALESDDP